MDNYSSESDDEVKIEFTDSVSGTSYTKIYHVPYRSNHSNEKKLICFSVVNGEKCIYGSGCTYAHSIEEQIIEEDKKFIYQIILDQQLMNFSLNKISTNMSISSRNESDNKSMSDSKIEEIYKKLLNLTHLCEKCMSQKCTGGYNCRNGVFDPALKICKNDLLTGECINKQININVDGVLINKISGSEFIPCESYKGCINGHHLTLRNLIPYYKYVHQKENSRKYQYQSVRYIDIDQLGKIFRNNNSDREHILNKQTVMNLILQLMKKLVVGFEKMNLY